MSEHELRQLLDDLYGPAARSACSGLWLVVSAHADDETIGASWLLARAERRKVVHVTDGAPRDRALWPATPAISDGPRAHYAAVRRREAEAALAHLGLTSDHIHNLGFVDQEAAHGLAHAAQALARMFHDLRPSVVVTHPYEGGHPDHDATAFAVRAALTLTELETRPWLVEMSSYHRHEGSLRTGAFLPHTGRETTRVLDVEERARKAAMFAEYGSQSAVLSSFRIDEERYRTAEPLRLEPPHAGPLYYESLGFALQGLRFRELLREALQALGLSEQELAGSVRC